MMLLLLLLARTPPAPAAARRRLHCARWSVPSSSPIIAAAVSVLLVTHALPLPRKGEWGFKG